MSRSVPWRHTVSDACNWHQSQALESTIYILRQTGPTGFLLKEEGERKNVKVFMGDPHTCTCPVFKKERDLCKHICWLLLRKFRLSVNDPLSWQLGLVEREINEILRGRVTAERPQRQSQAKTSNNSQTIDGKAVVEQREIAEEDVCPICQEELLAKKLPVTYCKFGCGNTIHIKCMKVWAEHQKKTSPEGVIKCPMCREDFGPIDLLKTESKNAGCRADPPPGIRMDRHLGVMCSNCSKAPIEGKCYRCMVCPTYHLCQRCFNFPVHTTHSFQFRQKRNQRWRAAPRTLGSGLPDALANDLMHREITEDDYEMLLQMERNQQEELSSLAEEDLRGIPVERVREGGPLLSLGAQCRICLRGFTVGQTVRKLPCRHKRQQAYNLHMFTAPLCSMYQPTWYTLVMYRRRYPLLQKTNRIGNHVEFIVACVRGGIT
ncbi:E3 ubiquitin-protein ligase zswim2-like [Plakobranchus ocellatus]|uniref:E3 ubiquitin-protein ligase zswim2-like n=1 Tax=Plakobranchus ocellatus TaxID=259542 RepID=A0AAV4DZP8_9GAST|nr:E3 ubiquitin-protein ligase zswim2-like [Plakobranchus ocellatus]